MITSNARSATSGTQETPDEGARVAARSIQTAKTAKLLVLQPPAPFAKKGMELRQVVNAASAPSTTDDAANSTTLALRPSSYAEAARL